MMGTSFLQVKLAAGLFCDLILNIGPDPYVESIEWCDVAQPGCSLVFILLELNTARLRARSQHALKCSASRRLF